MIRVFLLLLTVNFVFAAEKPLTVSLREITEDCKLYTIDSTKLYHAVDINSAMEAYFKPFHEELGDTAALKLLAEELENKALRARTAMSAAQDVINLTASLTAEFQKLQADPLYNQTRYRSLMSEQGTQGLAVIEALEAVGVSSNEAERIFSAGGIEAYQIALEELNKNGEIFGQSILNTKLELDRVRQELARDDSVMLRVWCFEQREKGRVQVHVKNYDNLEEGSYQPIDKLTLSQTEAEKAYLADNAKLNQEILQFRKDLQNENSELNQKLREIAAKAKQNLREFKGLFGTEELLKALEEAEAEIKNLPNWPEVSSALSDIAALKNALQGFANLKKQQQDLIGNLSETTDPLLLFERLDQKRQEIKQMQELLKNLATPARLEELTVAAVRLKDNLKNILLAHGEAQLTKANTFINTTFDEWKKHFSELDEVTKQYEILSEEVKANISGLLNVLGFSEKALKELDKAPQEPVGTIETPLSQADPAILELARTNREENDRYDLHIQARRKNGENSTVIYNEVYNFRALKFGLYRKWAGSLQFVKTEDENKFFPATSASYVLHYRYRSGSPFGGKLFDFGIGISGMVSADKEADIQNGAGVVVTAVQDILQAGYGWNFQADKPYFFAGVAILNVLKEGEKAFGK